MSAILEKVVTTQEAAKILGVDDSAIRHNIRNNKYDSNRYRASGKIYLFEKKYIEDLKKNKK